jgi:DNA-binding MarR family transcriptional regulator
MSALLPAESTDPELTGELAASVAAGALLGAVRRLRETQLVVNERRRDLTGRGLTDSRALDLIQQAESEGRALTPKVLAGRLRISTASTTILLDRLSAAGLVERRPHPTDRRSLTIHLTQDLGERYVADPLTEALHRAARDLPPSDAAVITAFVNTLTQHLGETYDTL